MRARTLLALLALALVAWSVCRPTTPAAPSGPLEAELLEEYERRGWDSYELAGDLARDRQEATR
jgi:hypothetical protein